MSAKCCTISPSLCSLTIYHATFHSVTDIYIFGIGQEIYDEDLKPLTVGTGGKHFFRMKEIDNLKETFDGIISKSSLSDSSLFISITSFNLTQIKYTNIIASIWFVCFLKY